MSDRMFSTAAAAKYLGIARSTLKHHIYTNKLLKPDGTIGRTAYFSQSTLDKFRANHRDKPGLTIDEVAERLNMKREAVKHHVYVTKRLVADLRRGNRVFFSPMSVEVFRASMETTNN